MKHRSRFAWTLACLLACKGSDSGDSAAAPERVLPIVRLADPPSSGLPELVLDEEMRFESKTLSGDPAELQNALADAKPKALLLTAEPDYHWFALGPIFGAAAAAGVERVEISVKTEAGANGVIPLSLVATEPETGTEMLDLRVAVWEQGYTITIGSDRRPGPGERPSIPLDGSGRYDTIALEAKIKQLVELAKGEKTLVIWASSRISLADLITTVEAVRGPECRGPDYFECYFAEPRIDLRAESDVPVEAPPSKAAIDAGNAGLLGLSNRGSSDAGNARNGGFLGSSGVSIGEPTVAGKLDRDIVKRVVRAHVSKLRTCYNERAKKVPALAGSLTIEFTIGADGAVSKAGPAKDNTVDEVVSTCMADAFKTMKFPEPRDGGTVAASITLELLAKAEDQ
jgi:hypothetical protein